VIAVDASAILAVLLAEPEAGGFEAALTGRGGRITAVNYWEVLVRARVAAGDRGRELAERLLLELGVEIAPIGAEHARLAADAFDRFGKGSGSSARLNLGDCFAYALAAREGDGLLFKGDDFAKTDVKSALT
jgi:ribonuclease VapC